jgi:hypothetical protein
VGSKNLYYQIAKKHIPEGTRCCFITSGISYAYTDTKIIQAPKPVTAETLYNFLHECAHILLHSNNGKLRYMEEMEAECYARTAFRVHGLKAPKASIVQGKAYVRECIHKAILHGAKFIKEEAWDYCLN